MPSDNRPSTVRFTPHSLSKPTRKLIRTEPKRYPNLDCAVRLRSSNHAGNNGSERQQLKSNPATQRRQGPSKFGGPFFLFAEFGPSEAVLICFAMTVSLTKVVNGQPEVSDTLTNEQTLKCPLCDQTYRLGYSDGEWNRVKDWLGIAERAIRQDHKRKHEIATLALEWKGLRRR